MGKPEDISKYSSEPKDKMPKNRRPVGIILDELIEIEMEEPQADSPPAEVPTPFCRWKGTGRCDCLRCTIDKWVIRSFLK